MPNKWSTPEPVHRTSFAVLGKPHGKKRHRTVKTKAGFRQYPDPENERWENLVVMEYRAAREKEIEQFDPLEKKYLVSMMISLVYPVPQSKPKWWKEIAESGTLPFLGKPDVDNNMKIVCDSLNGVAYKDDCQVFHAGAIKLYGKQPRTEVEILYFDPPERGDFQKDDKQEKNSLLNFGDAVVAISNPYGNGADGLNH